jgi:CHAT domain-containing protein
LVRRRNRRIACLLVVCWIPGVACADASWAGTLVSGTLAGRWCTPPAGTIPRLDRHRAGDGDWLDVGGVVLLRLRDDGAVTVADEPTVAPNRSVARWIGRGGDELELDGRVDAGCRFARAVVRFTPAGGAHAPNDERRRAERALVRIEDALARGSTPAAAAAALDLPHDATGLWGARVALARTEVALDAGDDVAAAAWLEANVPALASVAGAEHPATLYAQSLEAARLHVLRALNARARDLRERLAEAYARSGAADAADRLANAIGLGAALNDMGDEQGARATLGPAVESARAELGAVAPVTIRGELALARGLPDSAGALSRHLLDVYTAVADAYGGDAPVTASVLFAYAVASERAGGLYEAQAALERAHVVRANALGSEHPRTLALLEYLAFVRGELRRLDEAVAVQRTVLAGNRRVYGDEHFRSVLAAQNLGSWLLELDRAGEALPLLEAAHAAMAKRFGPTHQRTLDALVDRADAALASGDVPGGCALFRDARRSADAAALTEQAVKARFGEGRCALASAHAGDAVAIFDEVRRLREASVGADHESTLVALAALARARLASGDRVGATGDLRRLLARGEALRGVESPQSGGGRAAFGRRVGGTRELAGYRDLAWLRAADGDAREAIGIAERARARDVSEVLELHAVTSDARLPARERVAIARLSEALREVEAALAVAPAASAGHSELSRRRDALASELTRARARVARPQGQLRADDVDRVVRTLPRDFAIVGIQSSYAGTWVYALRRGVAPRVAVLRDGRAAMARAAALREALAMGPVRFPVVWQSGDTRWTVGLTPPDATSVPVPLEALARRLGDELFAPVAPTLRGAKHVVVVADGAYSTIPAEALGLASHVGNARVETSYVPSIASLASLRQRARRAPGASSLALIAIGAPEYARMGTRGPGPLDGLAWQPLPGARRELADLRALFPSGRSRYLEGGDATRDRLASLARSGELARARLVHVAAHGYLSAAAPQWSSLVLGADDPAGPGYVTAAELATFELDADLVTLSACETALGRDVPGEGLFGLPYALAVAGARATLLSLWRVDDASAAEFMRRFYRRLARGERPASALAAVKREFMRDAVWSAPFHWAPFVLYGSG